MSLEDLGLSGTWPMLTASMVTKGSTMGAAYSPLEVPIHLRSLSQHLAVGLELI